MKPKELASRLVKRVPKPPEPEPATHFQVHGGFAAPQGRPSTGGHVENLAPNEQTAALHAGALAEVALERQQAARRAAAPPVEQHIMPGGQG